MQVEHYTNYIQSKPEWELVEVYADDGISATNTTKREAFNRMIDDCRQGKIDMILTKSISPLLPEYCGLSEIHPRTERPEHTRFLREGEYQHS